MDEKSAAQPQGMTPWPKLYVNDPDHETTGTLNDSMGEVDVYTVSTDPNRNGWNTDGGSYGYGISKEWAERIVLAVNSHARLTAENERLRKALEAMTKAAGALRQHVPGYHENDDKHDRIHAAFALHDSADTIARSALTQLPDSGEGKS